MIEAPPLRLAAATGLVLAAAVALWWLGSTRIALDRGSDAIAGSAAALHAAWLVRGMAIALLGVRVGALRGWRAGAAGALVLVAPMWPVLVLAWSASTASLVHLTLAEGLLLAACVALPMIGIGLRRMLRRPEPAELAATVVGTALAALLWLAPVPSALPPP